MTSSAKPEIDTSAILCNICGERFNNREELKEHLQGCHYHENYGLYKDGTLKKAGFFCKEKAIEGSGFCIFHDKDYHIQHPQEVVAHLMKQISRALENDEPLFCIGYNIPSVRIIGKRFKKPVYFDKARFHGKADLRGTYFNIVSFCNAKFENADLSGVDFNGVQFNNDFTSMIN
jgi:hypothetical protein